MPRSSTRSTLPSDFALLKRDYYDGVTPARSDYAAATPSRFRRNRSGLYGSADSHYANEFQFIRTREYVRDMYRNDSIVPLIVERSVENQVQGGATPRPNTGDTGVDQLLKEDWNDWKDDPDRCDLAGESSFQEFEAHVARYEIVDGDCIVIPTVEESLQLFEAHLLRTPTGTKRNVVHGVLLDQYRRPLEYWLCPDNLDPFQRFAKVSDANRIPARDEEGNKQVFHPFRQTRKSQTRGVTAFHPLFDKCGMYEDADFAQLVKEQFAACVVAFLERNNDYNADLQLGGRNEKPLDDSTTSVVEGITPGAFIRGRKGEKLNISQPGVISTETMEHMRRLLMVIGANIGIPLGIVLLDGKEGTFSSLRTIFDQAKLGFNFRRKQREARFYRPVWKWRVRCLIASDRAMAAAYKKLGENIFRHSWKFPGWPYIQPLHDAQADSLKLTNYIASLTMIHAEDGREATEVIDESIRDTSYAIKKSIEAAKQLKQETGVDVSWKDVYHRDQPKGDQLIDTMERKDSLEGQDPASADTPANQNPND